jgi:hypothetical protein
LLFFSALLSHNAILYFAHGGAYGILPEKTQALKDIIWKISFYTHLPAGIICLIVPAFSFLNILFKSGRRIHQLIGKVYNLTTLLIVCPTGLYLDLYAKGGLITQTGFVVQGVLLWYFTYKGYQVIQQGNRQAHADLMIRSYAIATVVLTFRIYHILFFLCKVPYQDNYAISQWLGLIGNCWLAECIILFRTNKKMLNLK